jgi:hypothetical protein
VPLKVRRQTLKLVISSLHAGRKNKKEKVDNSSSDENRAKEKKPLDLLSGFFLLQLIKFFL